MQNIFLLYLEWHFIDRPKSIALSWFDFLKFNLNYWSIPTLLKTYFSYWHRYSYSYGKGFDIKKYFEAVFFNIISRVIGAIVRTFYIIIGLIIESFIIVIGFLVLLLWLTLPVFLILGFIYGFKILF